MSLSLAHLHGVARETPFPAETASEGTTARLWRRLRGPVDLVFVDGGASGELLAARARVHIAVLLIGVHLLPGWPAGPDLLVLSLAVAVLGYALGVRRLAAASYSTSFGYVTSVIDVSCVTASLALLALVEPSAPLHSIVRFQLYFLAILLSSLKMNWRITALAGVLCTLQYAALLALIALLAAPAAQWMLQIGRLGTLAGAAYLGTLIVLRAQQLRDLSTRDFLTGLANRAVFDSRLAEEISRARRHRRRFAVALIDVDHFKRFNDVHGHPAGDALLRGLAEVLKVSVRESDLMARYGGEEFAVIMPEAGAREAHARIETLRRLVEATPMGDALIGGRHRVTLSAGIAEYPVHGGSAEAVIATADARLYEAKRTGRNRVVAADR
jgi:diguanylate cyclase (GGDEF)-like protein